MSDQLVQKLNICTPLYLSLLRLVVALDVHLVDELAGPGGESPDLAPHQVADVKVPGVGRQGLLPLILRLVI